MMKKVFLFVSLSLFILFPFALAQTQKVAEVQLTILKYGLVIWTPANLNLGSVLPWNQVEKTFDDYFWVEDLRGSDIGYYTTIQCDGLYGPDNFVITWIQLLWNSIEFLAWVENQTLLYSNLSSWTDITQPQLYFYKIDNTPLNYHINKYWNKPSIRAFIPNDAPAGDYKWKITYTLYDMSFDL